MSNNNQTQPTAYARALEQFRYPEEILAEARELFAENVDLLELFEKGSDWVLRHLEGRDTISVHEYVRVHELGGLEGLNEQTALLERAQREVRIANLRNKCAELLPKRYSYED